MPRTPARVAPIATYWAARAGPAMSITTTIHTRSSPTPTSASVTELATSTQGSQASAQIAGVAAPTRYIIHSASRLERRSTSPPHHALPTSVAAAAVAAKTPTCAALTCRTSTRSSGWAGVWIQQPAPKRNDATSNRRNTSSSLTAGRAEDIRRHDEAHQRPRGGCQGRQEEQAARDEGRPHQVGQRRAAAERARPREREE